MTQAELDHATRHGSVWKWRPHPTRTAIVAISLLTLGACGGTGPSFYERDAVEACLTEKGYTPQEFPEEALASVGGPAAHGVIGIESDQRAGVAIAFERDDAEAERRAQDVQSASTGFSAGDAGDLVKTSGNVTYWATGVEVPEELFGDVDSCLTT